MAVCIVAGALSSVLAGTFGDLLFVLCSVQPVTGEDISDELSKLVSSYVESSDAAAAAITATNPNQSPQSSISEDSLADDSSSGAATTRGGAGGGGSSAPHPSSEEMVILRAQLEVEQSKNRRVVKELEEAKAKIMELNRRYQDATRAYEQERRVRYTEGVHDLVPFKWGVLWHLEEAVLYIEICLI